MFGRWSLLLDSASSPNAWWQQAVESSLLACKSCGSRVKCNAWNCKVIFLGSYDDERMSSIPVHFWFSVTGSWTWRIDSVSRPVLLRGLSRQKPTRGQASFASMELVEGVVEKWELLHYVWCLKMSKDFLAFSFSQPCVNVNLLNLVCGLFDSFAQSTAEIRELQCFYLGGILVAALWTTGDTRLHVLFGFGSKRWFLKALEESRHASMISKMYQRCIVVWKSWKRYVFMFLIVCTKCLRPSSFRHRGLSRLMEHNWWQWQLRSSGAWHALKKSEKERTPFFLVHKTPICDLNVMWGALVCQPRQHSHNPLGGLGSQPMRRIWSQHEVRDPMCRALWRRKNLKRDREVDRNDWRWKKDQDETTEKQGPRV